MFVEAHNARTTNFVNDPAYKDHPTLMVYTQAVGLYSGGAGLAKKKPPKETTNLRKQEAEFKDELAAARKKLQAASRQKGGLSGQLAPKDKGKSSFVQATQATLFS